MQNLSRAVGLEISDSVLTNVVIKNSNISRSSIESTQFPDRDGEGRATWAFLPHFQLDALGIVTLLGATQIDHAIGTLSHNWLTQYFPLMGAHVFASNQFTLPISHGIALYNITDSVRVTQLSGWFSRWLLTQKISPAGTKIVFSHQSPRPVRALKDWCVACVRGCAILFCIYCVPIASIVVTKDLWGLLNMLALMVTVLVRLFLIDANRSALDSQVREISERISEGFRELEYMTVYDQQLARARLGRVCQCLLIFPDGKKAYLQIPAMYWKECFTQSPSITRRGYSAMRVIGWLAFGTHVVTIGASFFVNQLWSVLYLLGATVLTSYGVGRLDAQDESSFFARVKGIFRRRSPQQHAIGTSLHASIDRIPLASSDEVDVYAAIQLHLQGEAKMTRWGLFPPVADTRWHAAYQKQRTYYSLPRHLQIESVAEQHRNFERHRRDMKERKRTADERGEIEIPLMADMDGEEMVEGIERGESSRPRF